MPLRVTPAPQIDDEALRRVLALPQLEGLDLLTHVLRNPAVKSLAQCPNLVDLTLELRLVDADTVDAVLAQLPALPALRRLRLKGHERLDHGDRPNDADLLQLQSVPALKRLYLFATPAVTDAGIEALRAARPALIVTRV